MSGSIIVTVDASISDLVPLFLAQRRADQAIAGASASYGFDELTALGERLSAAGRAGDLGLARQLKHELDSYLARLVVKYS